MDDYDHIDLDESDLAEILSRPMETAERLALLTLEEAYDVLHLVVTVAQEDGPLSQEADWLAKAIAVRIPSEN
jgi:BarA-like signal transduction histidine kinase